MTRKPPAPFLILADSAEPHLDAGDHPSALFRPCIVHAREWWDVPTERVNLSEGDYSLPGLARWKPMNDDGPWRGEPLVAIERKTIGDAISTVVGSTLDSVGARSENRDRFEAELLRLREYAWRAIVVEGTPADVYREGQDPRRRFNPMSVLGSYAIFAQRFGVQVWWGVNRHGAEWYVGTTLARVWSEHTGGEGYRKAAARGELRWLPWARETPTPEALEAMTAARLRAEAGTEGEAARSEGTSAADVPAPRMVVGGGLAVPVGEALERRRAKSRGRAA